MSLRQLLEKLRVRRERDGFGPVNERLVDNVDAVTAARANHGMAPFGGEGAIPPNYVKSYDDGRPRH